MSTLQTSIISMVICSISLLTLGSLGVELTFLGGVGISVLSAVLAIGIAGGINNVE